MLLEPPILCQFYAQFIHSIKHLQSAHHDPGTVPGNGCEQASKRNQLLYLCHLHSGCNQSVPFILMPSLLPSLMLPLSRIQLFATPWTVTHLLPCPCNSPGKNTGVGCHGIFSTQGSTPGLLHCRQVLYHLSHQRSRSSNMNLTKSC